MTRIRQLAALVATALTMLLAGCAVQPTDLPLPGTRVSDGYPLDIEFESVLNLPARSKVLLNGTRVGVLREVRLADRGNRRVAVATVDVRGDVTIPQGSTAQLAQSTLLGDFYIALTAPERPQGANLSSGATIPLRQTSVSPQVEDLLGGIAALANGGNIATFQRVISNANKAFPAETTERDTGIEVLRALIARTGSDSVTINRLIDDIARIARTLDVNRAGLGLSMDFGPQRVGGAISAFLGLTNVLNALGPNVVPIGDLILPRYAGLRGLIDVINPLVATAVRLDARSGDDMARIGRLIDDRVVPWLQSPTIDIVDVTRPDGRPAGSSVDTKTMASVLRMIGAIR